MACKFGIWIVISGRRGGKEDALYIDEEVSTIGAVAGAHQRSLRLVQIQVTVCLGILHRAKGKCIGSVWQDGRGRSEVCRRS